MDIQKERAAFEREWLLMGGDFQNYAVVDGMYVLNPNIASNVGSNFKELAERALNSSWALWLIQARQKQAEIDQLKSQAIPEGFVLDAPARVGGGTFQKGVKWSTVIKAAQRQFEFSQQRSDRESVKDLKGILFDVPEGFTLINKECSDEMAEVIAVTAKVCGGIAGDIYDAVVKQAVAEAAEGK